MTAIISFFIENGDKLVVVVDRQVTYPHFLQEENKFFHKGIFYIFCSGLKDVYYPIVSEIQNNRRNIGPLTSHIFSRNNEAIQQIRERMSEIVSQDDECSYLIVNSDNLSARIVGYSAPMPATDFDIIGAGEPYRREVFEMFLRLAPTGFQLKNLEWNEILRDRIIEAFDYLALKSTIIGHPALFGLDLFIFERNNVEHYKIEYKHDLKQSISYTINRVDE